MPQKAFIDSDVVISSIISSSGAAFLLLNQTTDVELFISNTSVKELEKVTERLRLDQEQLKTLIKERLSVLEIKKSMEKIKPEFTEFVFDINDAHIVAGAVKGKVKFLVTYNTKHFKADKLKKEFNIILTTTANLLQYLRSV